MCLRTVSQTDLEIIVRNYSNFNFICEIVILAHIRKPVHSTHSKVSRNLNSREEFTVIKFIEENLVHRIFPSRWISQR